VTDDSLVGVNHWNVERGLATAPSVYLILLQFARGLGEGSESERLT